MIGRSGIGPPLSVNSKATKSSEERFVLGLMNGKTAYLERKPCCSLALPVLEKTSVARAIAQDMGWNVIELNASDARNAAAIRKVATHGSTHRSLFHHPDAKKQRTLVLLDEVDHISGGLRKVSQSRIESAIQGEDSKGNSVTLKGDSGGKAELLSLLAETRQPVILACNEIMGLWGSGSSWSSTRDRFTKHLQTITFDRASNEALRRIARRVLREEKLNFDDAALEALVASNPGDLRALVRDLQVLSSTADGTITKEMVESQAYAGRRDTSEGVFPGLDKLYRSNVAQEAVQIGRSIEKTPPDMINWVHWNNSSLFPRKESIQRGNQSLSIASKMYMGQFRSTAHRSWYWSGQLASLSASVTNPVPFEARIYPSYPNFLRRGSSRTRPSILVKLGEQTGMSSAALRDEMLPLLTAMLKDSPLLGDSQDFALSFKFGFSSEEHASLAGLPLSRRATKNLMAEYDEVYEQSLLEKTFEPLVEEAEPVMQASEKEPVEKNGDEDESSSPPGQMKLF
ncbi:AAA family ATPase [Euryarchaeota archaeon]|nr:AAA family ATPase [Euryarchaeota archaeon]